MHEIWWSFFETEDNNGLLGWEWGVDSTYMADHLTISPTDLIGYDYPYWHMTQDTADKVSALSLEKVGRTLTAWLEQTTP